MKPLNWLLGAAIVATTTVMAAPTALAEVDISFGARGPAVMDDSNLFFSISSRYFDRDQRVINDWGRRFRNPDDLAVFFYICKNGRLSPDDVYRFRRRGMSWYDVSLRAGMPLDRWYVTVGRTPSGRYNRPYDRWNRSRQNPRYRVKLTDAEIRDLVAVRMAHEYYGVTPEVAMDWRRNGADVRVIMTREYHSRHRDGDRNDDHRRNDGRRDGRRDDRPGGNN